jgi:predicted amidohydrolase YtcJ
LEQSPDRDPNELVPLRRLLDAGVPVCLATDNVPPSLFHPLSHAVSRMSRDGRPVAPDQAITLTEALNCNTRTGAYLCFAEQRRGAIEPGFDADIVILDKNLHDISLTELADTKASKTIVAGKTVYQR